MPPNTTSVIQPMDQGVISTFKSYYLRRTFKQLLNAIDGPDKNKIPEFWKKYNIIDAIKNISDSWNEIKSSCMNGVWRKIWPECVHKSSTNVVAEVDETFAIRKNIANLAQESNFDGMGEDDINELFLTEHQDVTNVDLMELDLEDLVEDDSIEIPEQKHLTAKRISKAMALIDEAIDIFMEDDPDTERSTKVARTLIDDIRCYKQIYLEKRKESVQQTLDKYFRPEISNAISSNLSTNDAALNSDSS